MKKKSIFIITFLSIILLISLIFILDSFSKSKQKNTTYTVRKELYENIIEIAGTVSAAKEQKLQALGTGTVLGVYVKKGDYLKKGDLILQLDDTAEKYDLAVLDYKIAQSKISASKMELELLQKQRLSLLQKLADRKVVATFDGVIADLDISEGASLEAKDSIGTLVNTDYLTAEVEISETDVTKLKINQKVIFNFPSYNGEVTGYVTSWPSIGTITSRGATVVYAKLKIDNYPKEILPNYSFTGKIQIAEPQTNLVVEKNAIGYENSKQFVQLADTKEKLYIKAVPYGNNFVKIINQEKTNSITLKGNEVLLGQQKTLPSGTKKSNQKMPQMQLNQRPPIR